MVFFVLQITVYWLLPAIGIIMTTATAIARNRLETSVSETIRKPPLVEAQTA